LRVDVSNVGVDVGGGGGEVGVSVKSGGRMAGMGGTGGIEKDACSCIRGSGRLLMLLGEEPTEE
jgi:hypothetical protein